MSIEIAKKLADYIVKNADVMSDFKSKKKKHPQSKTKTAAVPAVDASDASVNFEAAAKTPVTTDTENTTL